MGVTWRKIGRDLWHNKARTVLVVLSIAVGVFALGVVFGGYNVMSGYLAKENEAWVPFHLTLWGGPFDEAAVETVLRDSGVADAERMVDTSFRWRLESEAGSGSPDWRDGELYAREDYDAQHMALLELWEGDWPQGRTLAVERMTARYYDIPIGATLIIQYGRHERRVQVGGIVRDSFADPPQFGATPIFFSTLETAAWLTGDGFNRLGVRMASFDLQEGRQLIESLRDRLTDSGRPVWGMWLMDPSDHWFQESVDTVFIILVVLGALSLGLSAFLIINTTNAIVSQQVWQIGVMKAVGATGGRLVRVYLAMALIYGGLGLLLAIPTAAVGAHFLAYWILDLVNIVLRDFRLDPVALAVQAALALTVPLAAALVPVLGGARITAHRAISTYGLGGGFGKSWLDRLVGRVRRLPRPLALSVRNTFRRKARVSLTLATLALGGAMFMMVMSVQASFNRTVDTMLNDFGGDVIVRCGRWYRVERLLEAAESLPEVVKAEVWGRYGVMLKLEDGTERYTGLWAIPPDTQIVNARIVRGRMLAPEDDHAMVLNHRIAADEGIEVEDEVKFDIDGRDTFWTVVGLVLNAEDGQTNSLVPANAIAQEFGQFNRGGTVVVVSTEHTPESQRALVQKLRAVYAARGVETSYFQTAAEMRSEEWEQFKIVLYLLLGMAVLAAVVGGIGMMSTMSINVVERRREIGVMRATGAGSASIAGIFVGEGVLLGMLSWLFAVPISLPGSRLFSDAVGETLLYLPFDFVYSLGGMALWLTIVIAISALASLWPALRAARVSVREALAYE